jgi:hypothetical protein
MFKKNYFIFLIIGLIVSTNTLFALHFFKDTNNKKYNIIYATGKIHKGDLFNLKRVYYSFPARKQTVVIFNSNGGELQEGIKLGKFLYKNKIATAVKERGKCVSSCALAYLGGRDIYGNKLMILPPNTKVGFHNFYYKNKALVNPANVQRDLASIIDYFTYVEAPSKLMQKMLHTKANKVFWISNRRHKNYLETKRISIEQNYHSKRKLSKNSSYDSKKEALKNYFYKVNLAIQSSNGYTYDNTYALNSYKNWLGKNLNYVYVKSIKMLKNNKAKVKVVYSLKNGKKIYSNNIYRLKRTQYGWRVVSKSINPFRRYKKIAQNIQYKLP